MPVYMVERTLPGATPETVEIIGRSVDRVCRSFAPRGSPVRFLRSTFIPGESRCLCLFYAADAGDVQEVNDAAHLPLDRIVLAMEIAAPATHTTAPHEGEPT